LVLFDSQNRPSLCFLECGGTNRRRLSRNPKASPFFGLFEDYFDEFELVYDDRFAARHGFWRPVIRKVTDRFLDCGDLRHRFARIRCQSS